MSSLKIREIVWPQNVQGTAEPGHANLSISLCLGGEGCIEHVTDLIDIMNLEIFYKQGNVKFKL